MKIVKKILIGIVTVIFFAFAVGMTVLLLAKEKNDYGVSQFGDTSLIIIENEVSSDNYKKGDLVIVKNYKVDKLVEGDEIFTYHVDDESNVTIDIGKVKYIHDGEDAITLENGTTYHMDFVAGKAEKVYNTIGKILSIIESQWGFLIIVLVPSFLIFISQIYALVVEIKYGKED